MRSVRFPAMTGYHRPVIRLLLLSILLATFLLPVVTARVRNPRRALASLLACVFAAELAYGLFLYVVYPRLI